jgi:hypothetical protein
MRRAGLLLLTALLVAGCVGVPSSGPVEPGLPGPVPEAPDPLVRPIANPPEPGMSRSDVVAGFLAASAAIGDDYQVARLYLSPEAAGAWDPGAGVVVIDEEGVMLAEDGSAVTAQFVQRASVSSSGVLVQQAPAPGALAFPMADVEGEWRIAVAPEGLVLTGRQLDRAFEMRNVFYLNPPRASAVPDVRLLPLTDAEALATALLSALLAGPSDWLAPGVASAIPEGMELALGAVPVADGVAQIDLQGPAVAGDGQGLEQFGAQLAWTLQQVPDVTAMVVTLDGRPLPLLDERGPVPLSAFERYDPDVVIGTPRLYGLTSEGAFAVVAGDQLEPVPGDVGGLPPASSVAAAPRSALVAGATADATGLVGLAPDREGPLQIAAAVASGPSVDGLDRLWWVDQQGRVLQTDPRAGAVPREVPLLGSPGAVRAVRPSRDGTRIAVLVGDGADRQLFLGVVAAGDAAAAQVRGLRALEVPGEVLDVAWRAADEVSVLSAGPHLVQRLNLLGSVRASFAVPEDAVTIADAPGVVVALGLSDGTAGRLTGDGVRIVAGLSAPAYPG